MSGMSDGEEIERLIRTQKPRARTRHTITDPQRLKRELEAVRKKGIAQDKEELNLGVKCVAAPIRNRSGAVVAAISLSGPAQRFTQAAIRRFEKDLKQASMEISQILGFVPTSAMLAAKTDLLRESSTGLVRGATAQPPRGRLRC